MGLLRNEKLTSDESVLATYPMYAIVGSWSKFKELMTFDMTKGYYKAKVTIGPAGMESFHILQDGEIGKALCPSVPDANPSLPHEIVGLHPGGFRLGNCWTIGGTAPEDKKTSGALYEVRLHIFRPIRRRSTGCRFDLGVPDFDPCPLLLLRDLGL